MRNLILNKDYSGIRKAISDNPSLADLGLAYDDNNLKKGHPLHRICDFVFLGLITDEEAVHIAEVYLDLGANVNGYELIFMKDTPLMAASSLHADLVAILYIDRQANIHHQGTHGATALHWAAWCGRDRVVNRLIQEDADVNKRCIDFESTPLFWAVKSYSEEKDKHNQLECIRLLIQAGADTSIPNSWGKTIFDMANENDLELEKIISH